MIIVQHAPVIDARHTSRLVGQQRLDRAPLEVGQVISAYGEPESEFPVMGKGLKTSTYLGSVSGMIISSMITRIRTIMALVMLALCSSQTAATSTVCSNPERARILATAIVVLPDDNIKKLEATFEKLSTRVSMTTWGVGSSENGRTLSQTLGLQSPKVSVSITALWKSGQHHALLKVERTCINDDLEPWAGYWRNVQTELMRTGYRLK